MKKTELIEHQKLSLDEWLSHVNTPKEKRNFQILDCQFASDSHLDEYLSSIHQRSDKEIKYLISLFLINGGSLGHDKHLLTWLINLPSHERKRLTEENAFLQRLMRIGDKKNPPWQSIHWVIDLLPNFPQQAIDALNSYFQAHCMYMPDGRIHGLSDAQALIRGKYMDHFLPARQTLLDMTSRDFELLVGRLYEAKGYDVSITKRTRDGGYDVLAEKNTGREQERLHIECKRYEQNVGVSFVRNALGTLNIRNATKAVLVTSANFTKPAIEEAHTSKRMELINVTDLDYELRKHLDYNWTFKTSRYLMEMKKSHEETLKPYST